MQPFINRTQAAEMFGVGVNTISNWLKDGTLVEGVHFSKVSNKLYFNRAELQKLLPGGAE